MNYAIAKIGCLLTLLGLYASVLNGQQRYDHGGKVNAYLMNLIHEKFGSDYCYVGFSILDSLISHSLRENDRIRDPYKTLRGCILFSTYKDNGKDEPNSFIAGMVKNGQIIWDNAPGTKADLGGELLYAQDINKDGAVDLLVLEVDREFLLMRGPEMYYLNILSWDGKHGGFLNAFLRKKKAAAKGKGFFELRVGKSAIIGGGLFDLADDHKDSIKAITAILPDIDMQWDNYRTKTFPHVTYTWNGKQYGLWMSAKDNYR